MRRDIIVALTCWYWSPILHEGDLDELDEEAPTTGVGGEYWPRIQEIRDER
jgi:hypothetical protein